MWTTLPSYGEPLILMKQLFKTQNALPENKQTKAQQETKQNKINHTQTSANMGL